MPKRIETLEITLAILKGAGYVPTFQRSGGNHYKIRCEGLPPICVSSTSSDRNAVHQARRTVQRIIAQNTR